LSATELELTSTDEDERLDEDRSGLSELELATEDISSPPLSEEQENANIKAIPKIAANAILLSLFIIVPPFKVIQW